MALDVPSLGREDDVSEVLVAEEAGEDPQHVVLVVVPLEAVLLLLLRLLLSSTHPDHLCVAHFLDIKFLSLKMEKIFFERNFKELSMT